MDLWEQRGGRIGPLQIPSLLPDLRGAGHLRPCRCGLLLPGSYDRGQRCHLRHFRSLHDPLSLGQDKDLGLSLLLHHRYRHPGPHLLRILVPYTVPQWHHRSGYGQPRWGGLVCPYRGIHIRHPSIPPLPQEERKGENKLQDPVTTACSSLFLGGPV